MWGVCVIQDKDRNPRTSVNANRPKDDQEIVKSFYALHTCNVGQSESGGLTHSVAPILLAAERVAGIDRDGMYAAQSRMLSQLSPTHFTFHL